MIVLVLILIVVIETMLLSFCLYQRKQRTKELEYIGQKAEQILVEESNERIKVVSGDPTIQKLCSSINQVLDRNSKNAIAYIRSQESERKMLSNISHDLKTPLTVILGNLEMMSLEQKDSAHTKAIYEKAKELLSMINEFFDLAKLESGDKQIDIAKVNLSEVTRIALLNFYTELEKKSIQVELEFPSEDVYVYGNQEALVRVLNNLIGNAVKYGMDGKHLKLRVGEGMVQVIDHGKGVEQKHQKEIFDRMYTLEDSRSREYGGSGLGLSITKALMTAMGGTIELNSIPYEQTIFTITLPTKFM